MDRRELAGRYMKTETEIKLFYIGFFGYAGLIILLAILDHYKVI